jgi:hypothetical protein
MSKPIPWPPGHELPSMSDLVGPIREVIERAYVLTRTPTKEFEYAGFETPQHMLHVAGTLAEDTFKDENLTYHVERGRDLLDVALIQLFNYGVQQGIRMEREKTEFWKRSCGSFEKLVESYRNDAKVPEAPQAKCSLGEGPCIAVCCKCGEYQ